MLDSKIIINYVTILVVCRWCKRTQTTGGGRDRKRKKRFHQDVGFSGLLVLRKANPQVLRVLDQPSRAPMVHAIFKRQPPPCNPRT